MLSNQDNLKKEKEEERFTAIGSIFFLGLATIAESFYEFGHLFLCPYYYKYYYIFTDSFGYGNVSLCQDATSSLNKYLALLFLAIAVGMALFIILKRSNLRKLLKRFIVAFVPVGIIILVWGLLSSYCLMMSCNDGLTQAVRIDGFLVLLVIFTLAWDVLLPVTLRNLGFLLLFLIPSALLGIQHGLQYIEHRPVNLAVEAIEDNNVNICPTITENLETSCIQQVAIGLRDKAVCEKVKSTQAQVFCVNAVEEQVALDNLDVVRCDNITESGWRANCIIRLKEKLK